MIANVLTFILSILVLCGYIIQTINWCDMDEENINIAEFWVNITALSFLSVLSFGFLIYDLIKALF